MASSTARPTERLSLTPTTSSCSSRTGSTSGPTQQGRADLRPLHAGRRALQRRPDGPDPAGATTRTTTTGYYDWPGNTLQSPDNPVGDPRPRDRQGDDVPQRRQRAGRVPDAVPRRRSTANVNLGYDVTKVGPADVLRRASCTASRRAATTAATTAPTRARRTPGSRPTSTTRRRSDSSRATSTSPPGTRTASRTPSIRGTRRTGLSTDLLGGQRRHVGADRRRTCRTSRRAKLISFFGRLNYNINDKYLLAVSLRRDGSSRFGTDNAWGTFPSVSVGWRLSEEGFFSGIELAVRPEAPRVVGQDRQPGVRELPAVLDVPLRRRPVAGAVRRHLHSRRSGRARSTRTSSGKSTKAYERRPRFRLLQPAVHRLHRLVHQEHRRPDLHGARSRPGPTCRTSSRRTSAA